MIRYALRCGNDHAFDSWFQSADAFEALATGGHLSCPDCGDTAVERSLMAPSVTPARKRAARPLTTPQSEQEKALAKLREEVEKNSDYVGLNFASEARAMHGGETPHRSIHGEANIDDAKSLIEDGVPVAPLPFTPRSKAN